jgi:ATP-binding cassette subfamily B protein
MKTLRNKSKLLRTVEVATAASTCLVLWWGAKRVLAGVLTPGDLLVFLSYLKSMYKPIRRVAQLSVQASQSLAAAERVAQILWTEPEIRDLPDAVPAPRFRGEVEFRGVSFRYGSGPCVLTNIQLRVEPGQTVAITGPSGAGKSTLLSLLPRLYDPTAGAILIDGVDVRRYTLASLRQHIAVAPQNPMLFGSTIRENIAYGDPGADEKAIRRAARLARAEEFIERLPQGYNSVVGERGCTLSGGQRQRLAIARALLRDAPIVILDEPMTGLDAASEELVLKGMANLLGRSTTFVIAHHGSLLSRAEVIVVLESGRMVESVPAREPLV